MATDTTAARNRAQRGERLRAVSGDSIFGPAARISDHRKSLLRGLADSLARDVVSALRLAMSGTSPISESQNSFSVIPMVELANRLGELPVFRLPSMLGLLFRHTDEHLFQQRLETRVSVMAGPVGRMAQSADPVLAQHAMALVIVIARRIDAVGTPSLSMDEVSRSDLEQVIWQVAATLGALSPDLDRDPSLSHAARMLLTEHAPERSVGERAMLLAGHIERAGWGSDNLIIDLITSGALHLAASLLAIRCDLRHADCLDILISDEPLCWAVLASGANLVSAPLFTLLATGQGRPASAAEAVAHAAGLTVETRNDILSDWRRDPVYRAARSLIRP